MWARRVMDGGRHVRRRPPGPWLEPFMRHGFRCAKVPAGRDKPLYIAAGAA